MWKRRSIIIDANRLVLALLAMLTTMTAVGCEQELGPETRSRTRETSGAPRAKAAPAPSPPAATADGPVGVAACDEWVERYVLCVDGKAPEAARASMKVAIGQTKSTWRKTAQTPEGRAALTTACTRMVESTRQATAPLGCAW